MSGATRPSGGRDELLARYRQLVLRELPQRAAREGWVVRADHCFGRIVLDHAVGGCWYDVLGRSGTGGRRGPAFERLDDAQLARAVAVAERVAAGGDSVLRPLDEQSLTWRGKPRRRRGDAAAPAGEDGPVTDQLVPGAVPASTPPAAAEAEEVRLVSEGFVDGVELFTWYDGAGRVLAEHAPLDPTLKQCGC